MRVVKHFSVVLALLAFVLSASTAAAKPLTEKGLTAMVADGPGDEKIVAKLKRDGVGFEVNADVLERLKQAGASDAVLAAVAEAGNSPAAAGGGQLITFDAVLELLDNGWDPEDVIAKLEKSPSVFTLSVEQEKQLRDAGATDALIAAMKGVRQGEEKAEPISDLVIVLDVSGSMKETTSDGEAKIDAAKDVVSELFRKIPEGLNVGLVIYGYKQGCSAVKVVRPLSAYTHAEAEGMVELVQNLRPVGNTPIALALRTAGEQLAGRETYCGVILVTDGLESCKGDPAAEAARLAENPLLRFGVNVVGFGLKDEEDEATAKIATEGGGKYYDAQNRAELLAAVEELTGRVDDGAVPPPVNPDARKGRRAVIVATPKFELPTMKSIVLVEPDARYYTVDGSAVNHAEKYDEEIRQPNADVVDIWWVPEEGIPVLMVEDFNNPEREVQELRPEDYLGLVRVSAEGKPEETKIVLTTLDGDEDYTVDSYMVQECVGYGKDLVVPAGTYNLWIIEPEKTPTMLEKDLEVPAGELTPVEN